LEEGLLSAVPGKDTLNTYAVNRFYKTPYAQTWNFSIQHELGRGMFVEGTYLGTKGTYLDVYTSPNSAPPGTPLNSEYRLAIPNATAFTFDTPVGNSSYNGAQLRFSERFNRGLSFRATYTFSKSIDDASVFAGTVAQNYRDIGAERGLSSFDHRHVLDMNWVLSSRYGVNRTSFTAGLLRNWTLSGGITAETGSPLTARVLGNQSDIAGSGNVGSGRADATGQSLASSSYFFNPAAFTSPAPGQYGNAGRNTIPGPGSFSVNAAFGRSFQFGDTRRRLEFRAQANNIFNNVNYSSYNTVVNATNFGLATGAGTADPRAQILTQTHGAMMQLLSQISPLVQAGTAVIRGNPSSTIALLQMQSSSHLGQTISPKPRSAFPETMRRNLSIFTGLPILWKQIPSRCLTEKGWGP